MVPGAKDHFTNEKNETWRGEMLCLRTYSKLAAELKQECTSVIHAERWSHSLGPGTQRPFPSCAWIGHKNRALGRASCTVTPRHSQLLYSRLPSSGAGTQRFQSGSGGTQSDFWASDSCASADKPRCGGNWKWPFLSFSHYFFKPTRFVAAEKLIPENRS